MADRVRILRWETATKTRSYGPDVEVAIPVVRIPDSVSEQIGARCGKALGAQEVDELERVVGRRVMFSLGHQVYGALGCAGISTDRMKPAQKVAQKLREAKLALDRFEAALLPFERANLNDLVSFRVLGHADSPKSASNILTRIETAFETATWKPSEVDRNAMFNFVLEIERRVFEPAPNVEDRPSLANCLVAIDELVLKNLVVAKSDLKRLGIDKAPRIRCTMTDRNWNLLVAKAHRWIGDKPAPKKKRSTTAA